MKRCFREPIAEIMDTARYLDAAASAHLSGHRELAAALFQLANCDVSRAWLESIWGAKSPYVQLTPLCDQPLAPALRVQSRMPNRMQVAELHARDGYHCRYCGIPVIRPEIRKKVCQLYPEQVSWGATNASQHAGFQTLWAQYDHVLPHAYGGTNDLDNLVVSCAACNFGKMSYRLEELGLSDPRERPPVQSHWDGLERLLNA
ncbi:HNH endonuclease signature motif containing protein [Pseudomonas aeruginosa]|uniref:HNH endonuclease n=1 Tax=Pseudomonas aeruginosa TaxID=287 RepID=UPI0021F149E8|nr:HNH endonuclease signature motif containing protein [Pseudomonas aeruginosa]MCV6105125.1 HNH endonuclease [Pseudomonas aeruginosa]MDI2202478.1 HNH endonuclease [Pseudomonas aeruginosa]MDY1166146.1 HNH endonuclease signature motif containing protein [Pseudomonas aeruginosa]HBO4605231.1 HNH endonuclease [Pseudomonas aeruginosa]